jgi:hypothetical protein
MPRLNNGLEVLKGISKVELFSIAATPGDTVTTEALAKLAATVDVTSATGFTSGDPVFIIGDGGVELNAVGTPATEMPLKFKAAIAQSIGARFVEAVARNVGHVTGAGVQYSASLQLTPIDAATSVTPIAYQRGSGELSASLALRGMNNLNMQLAHGVDEGETGVGSEADPSQIVIGGIDLGTHGIQCMRVHGYRFDGKIVLWDYLNITVEVQAQINKGGTTPAEIPLRVKMDTMVQRIW